LKLFQATAALFLNFFADFLLKQKLPASVLSWLETAAQMRGAAVKDLKIPANMRAATVNAGNSARIVYVSGSPVYNFRPAQALA
jgi:hypothetical protein